MQLVLAFLASHKLEVESLYKEYTYVVDTVKTTDIKQCLGKKTERQVVQKRSKLLSS